MNNKPDKWDKVARFQMIMRLLMLMALGLIFAIQQIPVEEKMLLHVQHRGLAFILRMLIPFSFVLVSGTLIYYILKKFNYLQANHNRINKIVYYGLITFILFVVVTSLD